MERGLLLFLFLWCDIEGFPSPSFQWSPEWIEKLFPFQPKWIWYFILFMFLGSVQIRSSTSTGYGDLLICICLRLWATMILSSRPSPRFRLLLPLVVSFIVYLLIEAVQWFDLVPLGILVILFGVSLRVPKRTLGPQRDSQHKRAYDVLRQATKLSKRN